MKKITTALSLFLIVVLTGCTVGANIPDLLVPLSITVTPADTSIAVSTTQQFTATGTYSDGTTQDLTSSVTWTASSTSVTFSSTTSGLATGTIAGDAFTISATLGLVSGTTTLTVTPATLVSIAVTPSTPTVSLGLTQQFTAIGTYSDGTTQNITSSVTWTSSNLAISTINATSGLATAVSDSGTSTITATDASSGIFGTATLTATAAVLESIAVTTVPAGVSLIAANGGKQQFKATGTYSDATQVDITASVTWTSSDTNITFGAGDGLVTCNDAGAVSGIIITATDPSTSISGSTSLDAEVLDQINITSAGSATTVAVGDTLQFTAIGSYSGGQTQDLTSSYSVWHSSSLIRATISSTGLATGVAAGLSNITAVYAGVTSSLFNLTVFVPPPLKMFVTTSTWNGELGQGGAPITLAAIDALCMADSNKPAGGATYKAMFTTTTAGQTRVACTTANCTTGGATENTNWVMKPNRNYYRADGTTLVGTTNSGGVIPLNTPGQALSNSISGVDEWYWTGLNGWSNAWLTSMFTCANWTYSGNDTGIAGGREGHGTGTTGNTNGDNGALAGWMQFCDTMLHLVCVEQ